MKKSTKRSAAKIRRRPHRAPILYVDECLGRGIALRLQSESHDAKPFDEFAGKRDVDFLPIIGERGSVLLALCRKFPAAHFTAAPAVGVISGAVVQMAHIYGESVDYGRDPYQFGTD